MGALLAPDAAGGTRDVGVPATARGDDAVREPAGTRSAAAAAAADVFVPSVRVTAPSGGTSTVQRLMYGEREAAPRVTEEPAAPVTTEGAPVGTVAAHRGRVPVPRAAGPLTAVEGAAAGAPAWLPRGVTAAVTAAAWSPFGASAGAGTDTTGDLSVDGGAALAALVARPLAAHLALLDRAAVALAVLKYDLTAHLRGLRAWMLLGEGQVATVFCEGLFERLAPTGGRASVAAPLVSTVPVSVAVSLANGVLRAAQGEAGLVEAAAELREEAVRRTELLFASRTGATVEDGAALLRGARLHCGTRAAAAFMHCFSFAAAHADPEAQFDGWDARATDALLPVYDWEGATLLPPSASRFCAPPVRGGSGDDGDDHVAHPLAPVLSPPALARYAAVHAFLLRLRRVSFEVRRLFLALRHVRVPTAVHRFRHEAAYFVSALEAYVAAQALEAPTAAFMATGLPAATSMRDVVAAHDAYLRTLLARCLVRDPVSSSSGSGGGGGSDATIAAGERLLAGVMGIVLRFARVVYAALASPAPGAGAEVHKLHGAFRAQVRVVVVALSRMADAAGGTSHAADLLARLRGNDYWA